MLLTVIALAVLLYGGAAAALYFGQHRLVFQPMDLLVADPSLVGLSHEEVRFQAEDGTTLHGWFVPSAEATHTLLFCHGNAGNISHRLRTLELLHGLGQSVLIFDYRGYGHSEGRPSEAGVLADGSAAWRYLTETRGIAPEQIVVMGRSLGGAVAAAVAQSHPARALILESTFTSVPELAADLYPWLPARTLSRVRLDTLHRVRRLEIPVLVIHSPGDEIVPIDHGRRLYEAVPGPKAWLAIEGGHNGGFLTSERTYVGGLQAFLETLDAPAEAGSRQPAAAVNASEG